jgi:hypothetical protein
MMIAIVGAPRFLGCAQLPSSASSLSTSSPGPRPLQSGERPSQQENRARAGNFSAAAIAIRHLRALGAKPSLEGRRPECPGRILRGAPSARSTVTGDASIKHALTDSSGGLFTDNDMARLCLKD